jgi:hypothetical protein
MTDNIFLIDTCIYIYREMSLYPSGWAGVLLWTLTTNKNMPETQSDMYYIPVFFWNKVLITLYNSTDFAFIYFALIYFAFTIFLKCIGTRPLYLYTKLFSTSPPKSHEYPLPFNSHVFLQCDTENRGNICGMFRTLIKKLCENHFFMLIQPNPLNIDKCYPVI